MLETNFNVYFSKKDNIVSLCIALLIESVLIAMVFTSKHFFLDMFFPVAFFLLSFAAILSGIMFYVKVNVSTIEVRTRIGRHYKFNCYDIDRVTCSKVDSSRGYLYYITLKVKSHEIEMNQSMVNFDKMAGYILDKHENGEIKFIAVSGSCKKKLHQYKKADFYKRKKLVDNAHARLLTNHKKLCSPYKFF